MAERPYDIVLFGATGFTGTLVAEAMARAASRESFRWAIAGRSPEKLAEVLRVVADANPEAKPGVIVADTENEESLNAMAAQGRVLISTVGPYLRYGDGVLRACVEGGTHYVDLTGEPEFVDRSRAAWHEMARSRGLRIVHSCGFDSIPHDLGALFTMDVLRERMGEDAFSGASVTLKGYVEASSSLSGGTWNSAIEQFSRAREYWGTRPRGNGGDGKVTALPMKIHFDRVLQRWACPLPTIDPQTVRRSARLRGDYGHSFAYGHYLLANHLLPVLAGVAGVGAVVALSQFKPTADLLRRVRPGGEGPTPEKRAESWFRVLFIAQADRFEVTCEVTGGDPGYDETAKMLSQSALCLALDRNLPPHTGVITPAAGMGHALIQRLQDVGIRFSVVR
ncbi:MAG: saccharopine dehydrogenase family protein [Gammaproteobacteria bacterium]